MGNSYSTSLTPSPANFTFPASFHQVRRRRRHSEANNTHGENSSTDTNATATNNASSSASSTGRIKLKRSIIRRKSKKATKQAANKVEFYRRVKSSPAGAELLACSFGSWCRRQRNVCGFSDRADYTSNRQPLLKLSGSPTRADTTEGRYFQSNFRSKQELAIHEKESMRSFTVHLPRVVSQELSEYLRNNRRAGRRRTAVKSSRVVAFHDRSLVVQVNSDQHRPFSKMYLIDHELKTCQGHFVICHGRRRWYEVYISPNTLCLLLRPDVRYQFQAAPGFTVQSITWYPPHHDIKVKVIPPYLIQHRLTFNPKLGDDHVIAAANRNITIFKLDDWSVVANHPLVFQYAFVRQIRSSPTGNFLAVRYTYPADGCSFNHILVLHYPAFTKALQIDVRGAYWPVSDLVNLQVFPRFSLSETCLAVMKQHSCSRKVFVYKLPSDQLQPLKQLCRQAILHLVQSEDVHRLPLPQSIHRYLLQPAL